MHGVELVFVFGQVEAHVHYLSLFCFFKNLMHGELLFMFAALPLPYLIPCAFLGADRIARPVRARAGGRRAGRRKGMPFLWCFYCCIALRQRLCLRCCSCSGPILQSMEIRTARRRLVRRWVPRAGAGWRWRLALVGIGWRWLALAGAGWH